MPVFVSWNLCVQNAQKDAPVAVKQEVVKKEQEPIPGPSSSSSKETPKAASIKTEVKKEPAEVKKSVSSRSNEVDEDEPDYDETLCILDWCKLETRQFNI